MSRRMRAVPVYLTYLTCSGFFFQMMSVVFSLFLILRLDLGPFQLVLLGTILEGTYLLFETPTGVVADTIGRRASVIIGLTGGGIGFILLGLSTTFWMAAASQVIWGIFATFESGADVAWLTDEVGEEAARPLYVRGNQFCARGRARRDLRRDRARHGEPRAAHHRVRRRTPAARAGAHDRDARGTVRAAACGRRGSVSTIR